MLHERKDALFPAGVDEKLPAFIPSDASVLKEQFDGAAAILFGMSADTDGHDYNEKPYCGSSAKYSIA